ncbi:MAG TPA: sodium:proton antiporter [Polyangia bacterium]|nr:sodium:proton antiporter [Polyangia bacterium]
METTPLWAVLPFVAYLLGIALVPIVLGHFWEKNRNKLLVALVASAPVLAYLAGTSHGGAVLGRTACDYLSFMALLAALFTISGGICLHGALVGSPLVNTAFLAAGSILGSLVGTTGASVLLIRPLLRANDRRAYVTHVVVFFIFIVSNGAGLLTPLGDPPLFLGFLRGVPFAWTLRLAPQWAVVNGALLAIFAVVDQVQFTRERRRPPVRRSITPRPAAPEATGPLRLDGLVNLLWLAGMVTFVFLVGSYGGRALGDGYLRAAVQIVGTLAFAALSYKTTSARIHEINRFSWGPIVEVAAVFVGVFITMVPAMSFLAERGATLGITKPWQFFWASGALSSVLDNAPTYLTFASLATGVANGLAGTTLSPDNLGALALHPIGRQLLTAVSCGAVLMGAVTYMGNGPNFMVKAIAEQHRVRMPSFFGYTLWSFAILVPLFGLVSGIFF